MRVFGAIDVLIESPKSVRFPRHGIARLPHLWDASTTRTLAAGTGSLFPHALRHMYGGVFQGLLVRWMESG